jgi:hypothetical protein
MDNLTNLRRVASPAEVATAPKGRPSLSTEVPLPPHVAEPRLRVAERPTDEGRTKFV